MGKTASALTLPSMPLSKKVPIAIFSLEMSKEQLVIRMLLFSIAGRRTSAPDRFPPRERLDPADHRGGNLYEAPMFIDDTAALSALELRAKARRLKADLI